MRLTTRVSFPPRCANSTAACSQTPRGVQAVSEITWFCVCRPSCRGSWRFLVSRAFRPRGSSCNGRRLEMYSTRKVPYFGTLPMPSRSPTSCESQLADLLLLAAASSNSSPVFNNASVASHAKRMCSLQPDSFVYMCLRLPCRGWVAPEPLDPRGNSFEAGGTGGRTQKDICTSAQRCQEFCGRANEEQLARLPRSTSTAAVTGIRVDELNSQCACSSLQPVHNLDLCGWLFIT